MMNFLPILHEEEDELFYSIVCRYKEMCGMVSKKALAQDLFNGKTIFKSTIFPQHLDAFVKNLPPGSRLCADEIIQQHTLFPFYTSFLSKELTKETHKQMRLGCGIGIENLVGVAGSRVKINNFLKFCPLCYKEDFESFGESFWRRSHQIIGVLYCLKHEVPLLNSSVVTSDNLIDYQCADDSVIDLRLQGIPYSDEIKQLNLKYMQNVYFLMYYNKKRKPLSFVIDFYIDRLREKGFASKSGSLYLNEIEESFIKFYPNNYLELMQSNVDISQKANWLRLFVRKGNKNRSPLRHLLFMQFLNIEVADLFKCRKTVGKIVVEVKRKPNIDLSQRRSEWLKIIEENPGASRRKLRAIGKGLHTWLYRYDKEWYDGVTPRNKTQFSRRDIIEWEQRDEECLRLAQLAVKSILAKEGKPIRIKPASIRREMGVKRWLFHEKLVRTASYLEKITEDIHSYRIRKIRWAIDDLIKQDRATTAYTVQLYAGFGGGSKETRDLIKSLLDKR